MLDELRKSRYHFGGYGKGICFVAKDDDEVAELYSNGNGLIDKLGLSHWEPIRRFFAFVYSADQARTSSLWNVTVPRALDGIDCAQFLVVEDCEALHGRTQPLTSGTGLRELVHRGATIEPLDVKLISSDAE